MPAPTILQACDGYRHSLDPLLLCAFALVPPQARVADLGTGSGVMPLLLAHQGQGREFVGIERQPALAARAAASVRLNGLEGRVRIVCADLRALSAEVAAGSFDVVLANPPYRRMTSGRVAPGAERAAARHELAGGLPEFLATAERLLKNRGRCSVVFLAERLAELLATLCRCNLEPKRLRLVHSRAGEPARLVLVEGRKNARPGLTVEAPLIVYGAGEGRDYSAELQEIFRQVGRGLEVQRAGGF
jgi:tRNA1Val (adenine37-N6)-methyltransferase